MWHAVAPCITVPALLELPASNVTAREASLCCDDRARAARVRAGHVVHVVIATALQIIKDLACTTDFRKGPVSGSASMWPARPSSVTSRVVLPRAKPSTLHPKLPRALRVLEFAANLLFVVQGSATRQGRSFLAKPLPS